MDDFGIPGVPQINALELQVRLGSESPPNLLDVREDFEREIVDLPDYGQRHIPVGEIELRWEELDPDQTTIVYCRTGTRSAWTVQFLQSKGFEKVVNLRGGVMGWREDIDPSLASY